MKTSGRAMMRQWRRGASDDRAAAIVEFAIIFPVLIILLFGMIDFGRAFFLRNTLLSGAREGARLGATKVNSCGAASVTTDVQNRVIAAATNLGGRALATTDVALTWLPAGTACGNGVVTDLRVTVTYPFTPITPVFRLIGRNGFAPNISVSATYRFEGSP